MGLFKGLTDKPYTKADYYREMEERAAAKLAAKADHVVLLATKEPEWSEPNHNVETATIENVESVIVPFEELSENLIATGSEVVEVEKTSNEPVENVEQEEPKKVVKSKRKKAG